MEIAGQEDWRSRSGVAKPFTAERPYACDVGGDPTLKSWRQATVPAYDLTRSLLIPSIAPIPKALVCFFRPETPRSPAADPKATALALTGGRGEICGRSVQWANNSVRLRWLA